MSLLFVEVELMETCCKAKRLFGSILVASIRRSRINGNLGFAPKTEIVDFSVVASIRRSRINGNV